MLIIFVDMIVPFPPVKKGCFTQSFELILLDGLEFSILIQCWKHLQKRLILPYKTNIAVLNYYKPLHWYYIHSIQQSFINFLIRNRAKSLPELAQLFFNFSLRKRISNLNFRYLAFID